jgi:hypothetical protein
MPILSSILGILAASGILELRGTWSSANPSPSNSLAAPVFSDGGPRGLADDEDGNPRLGVAPPREMASDIGKPASLEAAILVVSYLE